MVSTAGIPTMRNDSGLGLVSRIGIASPNPKVVIRPLHLLEFISDRRMLLEHEKSAAEARKRMMTATIFPASFLLISANATNGGHAIQHAVETLVLWIGPNSTMSGSIRADEKRTIAGPSVPREEVSVPNEENIHQAPNRISNSWNIRVALSTLLR